MGTDPRRPGCREVGVGRTGWGNRCANGLGAMENSLPLTPFALFLNSKLPFGEEKGVSLLLCF